MFHRCLFFQGANRPLKMNALTNTRKTRFFQIEDLLFKKYLYRSEKPIKFPIEWCKNYFDIQNISKNINI